MLRAWLPLMISGAFLAFPAKGQESGGFFNFFGGKDIDYWREGKIVKDHFAAPRKPSVDEKKQAESFQGANILRHGDSKKFSWDTYRDPTAPEFWDDGGDWIPPRPFREAAANPTPENIQNYLNWLAQKGMVVTRFQEALASASAVSSQDKKPISIPWQRVEMTYFYQSSCPHCQASQATVEKIITLGAKVRLIQLDFGREPPLHLPSEPYDAGLRDRYQIAVTPTWILNVGEKSTKVTGALTLNDLKEHLYSLLTQRSQP